LAISTKETPAPTRFDSSGCAKIRGSSDANWREALVEEYSPLVGRVVRKIAWCLPAKIEIADLMSAAWLGLLDAAAKYDPAKNLHFESYARIRIQGAIRDELRKMDWVPRSVRKSLSEISRTTRRLEQERGRPVREEEVAEALEMKLGELWRINEIATLIEIMQSAESDEHEAELFSDLADLHSSDFRDEMERNSLWEAIEHALPALSPKEETVLRLHYFEGQKLKEIGQVLQLSESRISQLHSQALRKLKSRLGLALTS
jgi:RNA polymerase sigma factor for flagellar operon FliA